MRDNGFAGYEDSPPNSDRVNTALVLYKGLEGTVKCCLLQQWRKKNVHDF